MAKTSTRYTCQACGSLHPKWTGKCEDCGAWNSLVEESAPDILPSGLKPGSGRALNFVALEGAMEQAPRRLSGIGEFDRVCGGGLVAGSALLVGGDPGIGKSTLLLQVVAALAPQLECAYVSGEEAVDQVRLRAIRLKVEAAPVKLASATNLRDVLATLDKVDGPQLVIIDSIQTMYIDNLESAPGSVSQVRACAQELIRLAKRRGFILILVGHVTKEGAIAGPRVLEHMVDTVLYFEGERGHQFRILRAVKNRFGATDEIGVFEMTDLGLVEVLNPSALFLSERHGDVSGACVFAGIEGTRPLLVEIQALVAPSSFGTPRRAVVGWDTSRLAMVTAVLETRAGVSLGGKDIYLNIAGGLKINEPAADLSVACALISSLSGLAAPQNAIFFGEIGLAGEVRSVSQMQLRLKEAAKLGFTQAFIPKRRTQIALETYGMHVKEISQVHELTHIFASLEKAGELQSR